MPRSPVQETRLWSQCLRLAEYLLHRLSVIAASLSVIALVLSYHAIVILCVCTLYVKAKVWCWVSSSIALYFVFFLKTHYWFIFVCMSVFHACMWVHYTYEVPTEVRIQGTAPGTGVTAMNYHMPGHRSSEFSWLLNHLSSPSVFCQRRSLTESEAQFQSAISWPAGPRIFLPLPLSQRNYMRVAVLLFMLFCLRQSLPLQLWLD